MKEKIINQESREMNLEARLGLIVFNSTAFGVMAYGVVDQISKGHYIGTAIAAILCVGNAVGVEYNSKKIIENLKK